MFRRPSYRSSGQSRSGHERGNKEREASHGVMFAGTPDDSWSSES